MSKMSRLSVEELEKRGIDPDQVRSEQDAEKHQMQSHLDDLIKEIQRVGRRSRNHSGFQRLYTSLVEELITALRNYNLVPEQPEPVMLQPENGEDVLF